jgi:hypothetical protein
MAPPINLEALRPFWEVGLGTALMLVILSVHGTGMFAVQKTFDRYWPRIVARSREILRRAFMGGVILSLLAIHYVEILLWASTLYALDALPDMRTAFYFAGGAYTTYGSPGVNLPMEWRLLGFMIATSGLFTFGWTTGILVSIVNRFFQSAPNFPLPGVQDDRDALRGRDITPR